MQYKLEVRDDTFELTFDGPLKKGEPYLKNYISSKYIDNKTVGITGCVRSTREECIIAMYKQLEKDIKREVTELNKRKRALRKYEDTFYEILGV